MPVHKVDGGYQWGDHGKVYPDKAGAEKQMKAAFANGYKGYAEGGHVESSNKAEALLHLSDICASAAGDLHLLHLNFKGADFDTMHKKTLKRYYEELDEDYDSLAEFGCCFDAYVENKNESAKRIGWHSIKSNAINRAEAIATTREVLITVIEAMKTLFNSLNKITDCPISIGIANWLQGRLEYWSKEVFYFNARRAE